MSDENVYPEDHPCAGLPLVPTYDVMYLRNCLRDRRNEMVLLRAMLRVDDPPKIPMGAPQSIKMAVRGLESDIRDVIDHHLAKLEYARRLAERL